MTRISFLVLTLNCFVLSWMVWPSFVCIESEQGAPGHLHCFSRKGAPYVSNLLHTENGEQTGRSVSDSWGGEFMSRLRR